MTLHHLHRLTIDLSGPLYETIRAAVLAGKGYCLAINPLKTIGKQAVVRAIKPLDEDPEHDGLRVELYIEEVSS